MIKINLNQINYHWLYRLFKQKEDTFIYYIGQKYSHDSVQRSRMLNVCKQVETCGKFVAEDLIQIHELGIPLGQITGFNLSGFRERTTPVSYDEFVGYLVNMCDGKFTKEKIKQTIISWQ